MASLKSRFEAATDFVRNGGLESASVGADEARQLSLTLYGLFKQVRSLDASRIAQTSAAVN